MANHKDKKWRGQLVNRGQLITGLKSLKNQTGISIQSLRTSLKRLKLTGEITIKTTNQYSIITVSNYGSYQTTIKSDNIQSNNQSNKQTTNDQQATNIQSTSNKNDKKVNNEKNVKNKSKHPNFLKDFKKEVNDIWDNNYWEHNERFLNEFIDYWTEPNANSKMRFQLERTWDTKRRLQRWIRNDFNNTKTSNKEQTYKMPGDYLKSEHFKERQSNSEPKKISELIKK